MGSGFRLAPSFFSGGSVAQVTPTVVSPARMTGYASDNARFFGEGKVSSSVLLEVCGPYKLAAQRCRYWADKLRHHDLHRIWGAEIKLVPGTGWGVYLARQDDEPMSVGLDEMSLLSALGNL